VCHIITGDKNRPVVKVLFPLHISQSLEVTFGPLDCKYYLLYFYTT
jgi:hypothetical protein